jgi:D-serine deaminase-like pyridoxal phosphate-dependent protein
VARLQSTGNFGGIAVSTLAEANLFAANGFTDILYAVPIEPGKFPEVIDLSKRCERFSVTTDDISIPLILNDKAGEAGVQIRLFLEVDCGYGRCGVRPEESEALQIARRISDLPNLDFGGILTHAGESYHARSSEALLAIAQRERDRMTQFAAELRHSGVDVPTVSIGSTPTISAVDHLKGIDEARPGNYIFFDGFQAALGACRFDDCAVTVLAAVVSRNRERQQIVLDAGSVALSKDRGPFEFDPQCGYGRILDLDGKELGLRVHALSQEHGLATVSNPELFDRLKVGSRLRILVNHACLAAAQHDCYHVLENGGIVDQWKPCRGW